MFFRRSFLVRLILAGALKFNVLSAGKKLRAKKRLLPGAGGGYPRSFKSNPKEL
jgi:hypothetical protein